MANRNYPKNVSATTVIPFDNPLTYIPPKTITGAVTFTKSTTGAQAGYAAIIEVTADGTNVPDVSAFYSVGTGAYDNTAGVVNLFTFFYTGQKYCVAVNPISGTGGGGGDTTPPGIVTVSVENAEPNKVLLAYGETLDSASVPATSAYTVKVNGTTRTISAVAITGANVKVTFGGAAVISTDSITLDYVVPGTNPIQDVAGNDAAALTGVTVGNNVTGSGTPLNAPTGVTLGTATDVTQPLTWTDTNTSPNENGYKVYRNTANNFSTATLATTTAANATSYTVTGLTASTLYYYWVVAQGNGTTTADSSPSTAASGSTGAAAEDAYTTAWATAAGVSAGSYRTAIDTFIKALRTAGILTTHFDFIHILCGGSEAASKLNLIDPTDADASFRATFVNSPTFASTGVTFDGTSQYINSHWNGATTVKGATANDMHIGVYRRTTGAAANSIWGITEGAKVLYLYPDQSGNSYFKLPNIAQATNAVSTGKGFFLGESQSNSTNSKKLYQDNTLLSDGDDNSNGYALPSTYPLYFGAGNTNGTASDFHAAEITVITGGKSFTSTQRSALTTAILNMATTLGW
jgi:hypothetical protein